MAKLLSHRHPLLYHLAVGYHRFRRRIAWLRDRRRMARRRDGLLPCLVKRHSSRLIKILGDSEIYEQHHRFLRRDGRFYRANEIWRRVMERKTGRHLRDEKIKDNFVRVMYQPDQWDDE